MLQYFYFSSEYLGVFYAICHISSKNIPVDRSTGMHDWVNQLDLDGRLWYCYQGQNHRNHTHSSAATSFPKPEGVSAAISAA